MWQELRERERERERERICFKVTGVQTEELAFSKLL